MIPQERLEARAVALLQESRRRRRWRTLGLWLFLTAVAATTGATLQAQTQPATLCLGAP